MRSKRLCFADVTMKVIILLLFIAAGAFSIPQDLDLGTVHKQINFTELCHVGFKVAVCWVILEVV